MSADIILEGQYFDYDEENDSCLAALFVAHAGHTYGPRIHLLTEAKKKFVARGYKLVVPEGCIRDDDGQNTLIINEHQITLMVKFDKFRIDEELFYEDVAIVARELKL